MLDIPLLVPFLSRVALGLVFIYAGMRKAKDPDGFTRALANYTRLPATIRRIAAPTLPGAEIALGLWLVSGLLAPIAGGIAISLLVAFALVAFWSFGSQPATCGCLGTFLEGLSGRGIAVRNTGLATLALPLIAYGAGYASPASAGASLSVAAIGGIAFVVAAIVLLSKAAHTRNVSLAKVQDVPVMGRRSFLGRSALAMSAATAAILGLGKLGKAEAACAPCQTCSPAYVFISCSGGCCGTFLTRKMKYCDGSCFSCSAWTQVQLCGLPECC